MSNLNENAHRLHIHTNNTWISYLRLLYVMTKPSWCNWKLHRYTLHRLPVPFGTNLSRNGKKKKIEFQIDLNAIFRCKMVYACELCIYFYIASKIEMQKKQQQKYISNHNWKTRFFLFNIASMQKWKNTFANHWRLNHSVNSVVHSTKSIE